MIICAGESEQFDFAVPVGIGLIDAAINLTKICLEQNPKEICFVGSAGSYGDHQIFDIIETECACNVENSFLQGQSYSPIVTNVSHETSPCEVMVNSSNYITTEESLGEAYLEKNIHLENMEFYAIMKVAKAFSIPVKGVLVVTNYCNENAHRDFMNHHKEAMERLTRYIEDRLA